MKVYEYAGLRYEHGREDLPFYIKSILIFWFVCVYWLWLGGSGIVPPLLKLLEGSIDPNIPHKVCVCSTRMVCMHHSV